MITLLALTLACSGSASTAPAPTAPTAPVTEPGPDANAGSDDVGRIVALSEACLPPGVAHGGPAINPAEGRSWRVGYATAAGEVYDILVDPWTGTCDGEAVRHPVEDLGVTAAEAIAICWEAAGGDGAKGVMGSALLREPRLGLREGTVFVSFPEADPVGMPSGQDMALDARRKVCSRTIMD